MTMLEGFDFRPHPAGFQAVAMFDNGFGVSVIPEPDYEHYEVAILRHNGKARSHICYDSGLTDDVFRFLSVDEVHAIIMRARNLKAGSRVVEPNPFVSSY